MPWPPPTLKANMTPLGLTGELLLSHLLFWQKVSVSPCGIQLDQCPDIFHANTTIKKKKKKRKRGIYGQEGNSKANLESTLAKGIVQSSSNVIKSNYFQRECKYDGHFFGGAGWDWYSFREPRPDLGFHEPEAMKIWGVGVGGSGMFFFHREKFQLEKKTQLRIANGKSFPG